MCGINGIFAYHGAANPPDPDEFTRSRDRMAARGPDADGAWWSEDRRLVLGNRRLAIIDLDHRSDQPLVGEDALHVVTFNGAIYNFPALRAELEARGRTFRTTSDTEVLLHLYAVEGERMVEKLRGMFAFAIWDARRKGLFLARDPYGIKPLYTCDDGWTFRFASQVKALLAGGKVSRDPEPAGVVGFHLYGSVPEPFTLYRDIRALPAGYSQWIDEGGPREPVRYASVAAVLAQAAHTPLAPADFANLVRTATLDSVKAHCLADVEVGLFLSAGVDSGAMLGLMRDAGQNKIRAITLGFADYVGSPDDEVPLAGAIAELYGATHVIRRVTEAEFHADLPDILDAMDQPSIDGVNTWFVAKAAREAGLKVALSGLGGDELLGGYPSFHDIPQWTRWLRAPAAVPGLGAGLRWLGGALGLARHRPKALGMVELGGTYRGAYLLRRGLFLPFELPPKLGADLVREGLRRLKPLSRLQASMTPDPGSPPARICALESANYMRNQLLRDADWAGMAQSLEVRCPLVDYDLLRALAPAVQRMTGDRGKRALAAAPTTPVPAHQVQRAKTGFSVPTDRWLADTSHAPMDRPISKGLASRAWGQELFEAHWAAAGS